MTAASAKLSRRTRPVRHVSFLARSTPARIGHNRTGRSFYQRSSSPDAKLAASSVYTRSVKMTDDLAAYNAAKAAERERLDAAFTEAWNYWFKLWGEDSLERWYVPDKSFLRRWVRQLPVEDIKDAMEIAIDRKGRRSAARLYLGGVIRNMVAEREAR